MVRVMTAAVAAATAAAAAPCAARADEGFWFATVPTFWHGCSFDEGGLSDEYIDTFVAGNKMVTIEKGEALRSESGAVEEDIVATCARVKSRLGEDTPCFTYLNILLNWAMYSFSEEYAQLVRDEASVQAWRKNGDSTFPHSRNMLVFDLREPVVQEWWLAEATKMVEDPAVDGIFVDRAYLGRTHRYEGRNVKDGKQALFPAHFQAYSEGREMVLRALAERTTVLANPGVAYYDDNVGTSGYRMRHYLRDVQAVQLETFCASEYSHIVRLNQAVRAGKTVQAHGGDVRNCDLRCSSGMREYLAAFLVGVEDHTVGRGRRKGWGKALFACHEAWHVNGDSRGELQGYAETALPLGRPGPRLSSSNLNKRVQLRKPSRVPRSFGVHRAFFNLESGALQAVAVWTRTLRTVCFVQDCARNGDLSKGKRCLGNPRECAGILEAMQGHLDKP